MVFQSQYTGPNGRDYDNYCEAGAAYSYGLGSAQGWWNGNDCVSNDWVVRIANQDGTTRKTYDQDNWREDNPSSNGYYDFNTPAWSCCTYAGGGGGGGGGGGSTLGCLGHAHTLSQVRACFKK